MCVFTYYGVIFYTIERQISVLFINYKESVFCIGVMSSSFGEHVFLALYHFFYIDFHSDPSVRAWLRFNSLTWQGDGPFFISSLCQCLCRFTKAANQIMCNTANSSRLTKLEKQ